MDKSPMNTSIAQANALHRMLLQSLLATRFGPAVQPGPQGAPPQVDAGETMPMLYRSEAFAEDLVEPQSPLP